MKLWRQSHNLQRKVIAAIVLVGLLPLTLSLVLTYLEQRRALRETIGANFKEIAVETARRIEMQLTRGINEAEQLATVPFLRTAVTEANRSYVGKQEAQVQAMIRDWQQRWRDRERQGEFPLFINRIVTNYLIRWHEIRKSDYVGILLTDNRGALVVSSIPQVEYYYGKTPWWQAVFNEGRGQTYVSDIYFEPSFGTHVLNVSVPIMDEAQHEAIGAVSVLLRRNSLFRAISDVTIGDTGHAMLMNSEGTPLICPVLAPEEHTVTPALVQVITAPKAGWVVAPDDSHGGKDGVVGFAPLRLGDKLGASSLGGKGWITFVRQDPQEAYASLDQLLGRVAAYGLVVLAVLWGTGVLAARRIVRPIRALQEGAQVIGSGNLDHTLSVRTGDEIEQLADAFNKMASNLRLSFQQIEQRMADIRQLEEKYRDLIENSPEMIHQVDKAGRFVHVNQTELEKLGYSLDEMLEMHLWDIVPRGKEPEVLAFLERMMAQGRGHIETVFLTRDGKPIDVEIHSTALFDLESGGLVYSRAFVRDITERKALEQKVQTRTREIEETKQYLENLLETANDVIYTLDRDQHFTYVNNKIEAWGYKKEDLIGRPYLSLLSKRHRGRRLKSTLDIGAKQVYEVEVMSKTGETRVAMVSVSPLLDSKSGIQGVLGIARDITETKKLEQQIMNSEKLASIGKLAAGVAHEINNPLGGILSCLYNLRKGTVAPARQEEYLASMEEGLRRVQKIVRQLLDFSQQYEPELSFSDLNAIVDRVLVLTNHALTAGRIKLVKRLQEDLPAVLVDRHMIEQVLMNLILNAVQAIQGGGVVTIRTVAEDEVCKILVEDTGCGIPSHLLSRIFDPFFTTKPTGEGTGLGLSVSLGIVERHGGRILVDSEIGKGTVFTVCLPLSRDRCAAGRLQ